jgi:hypothetical protein
MVPVETIRGIRTRNMPVHSIIVINGLTENKLFSRHFSCRGASSLAFERVLAAKTAPSLRTLRGESGEKVTITLYGELFGEADDTYCIFARLGELVVYVCGQGEDADEIVCK